MLCLNKMKIKPVIFIISAMVFLAVSMISLGSLNAYAIEVIGAETGLRVNVSGILAPTDNLAPGDTETSSMTISLDPVSEVQASSLPVWLKSEMVGSTRGRGGGNLDDRLELTVTHQNGKELYKGPVSGFQNAVKVGDIPKGGSVDVTFSVHLPGSATGNEYQAASLKVKWIVITEYVPEPTPTSTNPPSGKPPRRVTPTPITPTPTPSPAPTPKEPDLPPAEPDENIIEIQEELIPGGSLPKTGELPPILFYCLGAGIVYVGIRLNKNTGK